MIVGEGKMESLVSGQNNLNLTFSDSFPLKSKHSCTVQSSEFFKEHLSLNGHMRGDPHFPLAQFLFAFHQVTGGDS